MPPDKVVYSVVIPVYNSTDSLIELVERLDRVFEDVVREPYEVILVDDGSPNPETWPTMESLAQEHEQVVAVQLMRNFGKTGAVLCGLERAQGDYIFTMDDDLQHFPEDIPKFVEKKEHDVVMGIFAHRHHPWHKRLTSRIKGWFDHKLIGKPAHIQMGPFKLFKSVVVRSMLRIRTPYPFIPALIFYTTRDVVLVDVAHGKRKFGRSDYSFAKRLQTFSNLLINNSVFLLRVVAVVGVGVSLIGFVLAGFFITRNLLFDIPVPGWMILAVLTSITNGLILLSVGIASEYVIRMIGSIENRPAYLVRRVYRKHGRQ